MNASPWWWSSAVPLALLLLLVLAPSVPSQAQFTDPLGGGGNAVGRVEKIIVSLIKIIAGFVGLLATATLVWGGVRLIGSLGNPDGVKRAKSIILWALVGLLVAGGAQIIIVYINSLLFP